MDPTYPEKETIMARTHRFSDDTRTRKQMIEDAARWERNRKVPHPAPPCECRIEGRRCTCAIPTIGGDYGGRFPLAA